MNSIVALAIVLVSDDPLWRSSDAQPKPEPHLSPAFDFAVAGGAGAGWFGLHLLAPKITRTSCPCDRYDVNVIDRPAVDWHLDSNELPAYTALGISLASSMAALLLSEPGKTDRLGEFAVVLEATMITGMVTEGVKSAVSRPYPFLAGPAPYPEQNEHGINYQSFWSGHTAVPLAAAASTIYILHRRHARRTWRVLAWVGGALMGVVAGSLEVAAGNHYPTDVLVGGLAGAGGGVLTAWLHGI